MLEPKCTWIRNDSQLFLILNTNPDDIDKLVKYYIFFINKWNKLIHPSIFNIKSVSQNKTSEDTIKINFDIDNIDEYYSADHLKYSSPFEKISIFKQLIDINHFFQKNNFNVQWHISQLYIHPSGVITWLPPSPKLWVDAQITTENSKESTVQLFFDILGLKTKDVRKKWKQLIKGSNLPLEWGIFINYYLSPDCDEMQIQKIFSFIFYKSWLYIASYNLGMKDNILTHDDYQSLFQFGLNLELSPEEIKKLDVLAQLPRPLDWKEVITIITT